MFSWNYLTSLPALCCSERIFHGVAFLRGFTSFYRVVPRFMLQLVELCKVLLGFSKFLRAFRKALACITCLNTRKA